MSISPIQKEDKGFQVNPIDKTKHVVKETFKSFFTAPIHYIFYSFLFLAMAGLTIGRRFDWQFYFILIILGIFEALSSLKLDKE
mgnify:CR=1 FL=1